MSLGFGKYARRGTASILFACALAGTAIGTYNLPAAPHGRSEFSVETRHIASQITAFLTLGACSSGLAQACCVGFGLLPRRYVSFGELAWYFDGLLVIPFSVVTFLDLLNAFGVPLFLFAFFCQFILLFVVPSVLVWRVFRAWSGHLADFPDSREWLASTLTFLAAFSLFVELYMNPINL